VLLLAMRCGFRRANDAASNMLRLGTTR